MFEKYTLAEIRSICQQHLSAFEDWGRRFVDDRMRHEFGDNYIYAPNESTGHTILKKTVVEKILKRQKNSMPLDGIDLSDLIYIICHPSLYDKLFADALRNAYPCGREEARSFMMRLVDPRNNVSHANPISHHQAEQVVCYVNDFIESLKAYYKEQGMERTWNVPRILKIEDSMGNRFRSLSNSSEFTVQEALHCGQKYIAEAEIDPAFLQDEYEITWTQNWNGLTQHGPHYSITLGPQDVGENNHLYCTVTSNKEWHRFGIFDDMMVIDLTVLPPI